MSNEELNDADIDYIMGEVRNQLHSMSAAEQRSVRRSRDSFLGWLMDAVQAIGRFIGKVISFPFRLFEAFFEGLDEGLNNRW